jgi:hypothetical protein
MNCCEQSSYIYSSNICPILDRLVIVSNYEINVVKMMILFGVSKGKIKSRLRILKKKVLVKKFSYLSDNGKISYLY